MSKQFFFRCTSNPSAKPLEVNTPWEAKEMQGHPDYEQIDGVTGEVIENEDALEGTIPFQGSLGRK